jgi:aldehyde dehydrogenase (NAD+)
MLHSESFYIDGRWVDPVSDRRASIIDPTTDTRLADFSLGNAEDVERAVAAARRAFTTFAQTDARDRIALLERIIAVYEKHRARLEDLIAREVGTPRSAAVQTQGPLDHFRYTIGLLKQYAFEKNLAGTIVRREPIGVCGLIAPWNWPLQTPVVKLCGALAAGCTVVLKPSENSPLSAIALAEILDEAGVPAGVFNLVNGDGPGVGEALCRHPDVDMISFTGSTRAGILVAQAAAPTVKRVAQELGGKSANVVLPDADLDAAAKWTVGRAFFNGGQSCHAPSRMLVHESQQEEMLRLLAKHASAVRIGDPRDPATTMGPLVNAVQFERVRRYISLGVEEGARLVCGGTERPDGFPKGCFVRPTIFGDVTPAMAIAREEIFGPVLSVLTYRTEDEAVSIANDTPYGLGGYVFSASRDKGLSVSRRLRAGRVFYNGANGNVASPMGGFKQSGNGREMGIFGLEEFLEVKAMFGFDQEAADLPALSLR